MSGYRKSFTSALASKIVGKVVQLQRARQPAHVICGPEDAWRQLIYMVPVLMAYLRRILNKSYMP